MEFENFKEKIKEDIPQRLQETGKENITISFGNITKPNESYESMTIQEVGNSIGINVNLTQMYDAMSNGTSYLQVLDDAVNRIEKGFLQAPEFNINNFRDYDQMKETLLIEVVSIKGNEELLDKIPHMEIEDMAAIYRFEVNNDSEGRGTVLVTNTLLEQYGITAEQIKEDALVFAPLNKPAIVKSMTETMIEIMGEELFENMVGSVDFENDKMYVATVSDKIQGAGVVAYPEFMEQASEKIGCDFYVLPSSRHEVLLVKDDGDMSLSDLKSMVQEVNETQVTVEDKLTDNVYHYDSQNKIFELGEKFEARQQGKEENDRSVLKMLENKKMDIDKLLPKENSDKKLAKVNGGETI